MYRILVVEDTLALHYILRLNLEAEGYQVTIASTIREGMLRMATENHDLILLDHNLPDGCSDDLLYNLRHQLKKSTPVIVMSGSMQEHTIRRMLELGANDYFIKPFSMDDLVHHVSQWLPDNVAH